MESHITIGAAHTGPLELIELAQIDQIVHELVGRLSPSNTEDEGVAGQSLVSSLLQLISRWYGASKTYLETDNQSETASAVMDSISNDDIPRNEKVAAFLYWLGRVHYEQYQQQGQFIDLNMAIKHLAWSLSWMPKNNGKTLKIDALNCLGGFHLVRFVLAGNQSDLQQALEHLSWIVVHTPDDDTAKPHYLTNLGSTHRRQFEITGQLQDLTLAVEYSTKAISLTPEGDVHRPGRIINLGNVYVTKYERFGQLEDLDAGVKCFTQAVFLLREEDPVAQTCLSSLGGAYLIRNGQKGEIEDIDAAIQCIRRAVSLTPFNSPDMSGRLSNLGMAFTSRFERLGQPHDLEAAVVCLEQALSVMPYEHLGKAGCLNCLAVTYVHRYKSLGQIADLDAAINYGLQVSALIAEGNSSKPTYLSNLGCLYECRYCRLRDILDLMTAIKCHQQALSLMPDSYPGRPMALANLGGAYFTRYWQLGEPEDLASAVRYYTDTLSLTPDGHPNKPEILMLLGRAHQSSYMHIGQLSDLDLAIQLVNQAVSLLPGSHPHRPVMLSTLGEMYGTPDLRQQGYPVDMELEIALKRTALSEIPDGHTSRTNLLSSLAACFWWRYRRWHNVMDLFQSLDYAKQAAHSPCGIPEIRIHTACQWARLSYICNPQSAFEAYQLYISLIPQLVWLGMASSRRFELVSPVANMTLEGATVAILLQSFDLALEWLEQGRSIVWNQLVQLRSPLDELHEIDPLLAKELESVAYELHIAASLKSNLLNIQFSLEQSAQRQRRLAERWEWLIGCAQSLPGMCNFLAPKKASTLVQSAHSGAVVVVVAGQLGCDALVIRPTDECVAWVPLWNLSCTKLVHAHEQLNLKGRERARMERKFVKASKPNATAHITVLHMLWTDVAKPVLDYLGYTETLPVDQLPRITWCTTGPLSFLPLHAAGDYSQPNCALFDYAISSYTPTLSALLAPARDTSIFSGIAIVGQESTPGFSLLPGTRSELDIIGQKFAHMRSTRLEGSSATCNATLNAMQQHSWVHFACHASQNLANPTASAFHLHDGPLDLATITQKHVPHADLAFLSACQTATGDKELSEEAVHLAAGLIMTGYRAVIATMWPIHDQDAPFVAERFYEYMLLNDRVPDSRNAARALHYATSCLRAQVGAESYTRWAPYIHVGN